MPPQNGGYKKRRGSLAFAYPTIQALACPSEKISNAVSPRQDDIQQIPTPFTGADD